VKTDVEFPPILIDTREPHPHPWAGYWQAEHIRGTIPTGDISLPGAEHLVCIERKATDDLIGCLCGSRERFEKELRRAQTIPHFWVICEGSYADLFTGRHHSQMNPQAAFQSVVAMMIRYRVPFLMAGTVQTAAHLAESLLLKWYRQHAKTLAQIEKAAKTLRRAS